MSALEALQRTLAGEHAAIYVYGVLGGRVSATSEPTLAAELRAAYSVHRARRDQLVAMVAAEGAEPVPAAVGYEVPTPARTASQCRTTARKVESRCAQGYAATVASTARAHRQWAIEALEDAAVRGLRFGAEADSFPGAPEL
ncbi:ferritin-like domain-containing protein [soil metagenome]